MSTLSKLQCVRISYNHIIDELVDHVIPILSKNTLLRDLEINDSILQDKDAMLAKPLYYNSINLRQLTSCNISNSVGAANNVASVLSHNATLQVLSFSTST